MVDTAWHREAITEAVERTLTTLVRRSILNGFYLAGGTAIALRIGHRRSLDLDFFSADRFPEEILLQKIQQAGASRVMARSEQTLHLDVIGTKVTFLWYGYPALFPMQDFQGVPVADLRDVACMKLSAIASRGSRRDFIDLYVAARQCALRELMQLFRTKFAQANYSMVHVLKSLTYFEDAEKEPVPEMLAPITWTEVKNFFLREAPRLL